MAKHCIVCGKKLKLFEAVLGDTCSYSCQNEFERSTGFDYPEDEYTDYPDVVLDVTEIELHSLPVITDNSIQRAGYNVSSPIDYVQNDNDSSNNDEDDYDDVVGGTGVSFPPIDDDYYDFINHRDIEDD